MNNDRKEYIINRLLALRKEQEVLQQELAEISMQEDANESSKQFLVEGADGRALDAITKVVS